MNEQIRLLEDTIIETLNSYEQVPIEAKRLVLKEIYLIVEQKANEAIIQEVENAKSIQPNKLGELPE